MKYAVVKGSVVENGSFVDNVIIVNPDQKAEMEAALGAVLLDATPLGLENGDLYNGISWTRNIDGEQVALPIETDSADVLEMLAILRGEVE